MFNVCPGCGSYHADMRIDPDGPFAVCPDCGHAHPFRRLPLFIVTGASGSGKTSLCLALARRMDEVVVMESDILWRGEYNRPEDNYREYRELWLRVCKNISQAGRPVVLCGCAVPKQFEGCVERRYFSGLHYLALVCDDAVLAHRLKSRPGWRQAGSQDYIAKHVRFNGWIRENAASTEPPMRLLDSSGAEAGEAAEQARRWILGLL